MLTLDFEGSVLTRGVINLLEMFFQAASASQKIHQLHPECFWEISGELRRGLYFWMSVHSWNTLFSVIP